MRLQMEKGPTPTEQNNQLLRVTKVEAQKSQGPQSRRSSHFEHKRDEMECMNSTRNALGHTESD